MKKVIITLLISCVIHTANPQVAINPDATAPDASAMLDVNSKTKGALVPRMNSAERLAITKPAVGLLVFDTEEKTLYMFDGQQWLGFAALTNYQRPASNFIYGPDSNQDTTLAGYSVSMWDQFAAIGVPYKITGLVRTGGVYLYKLVAGNWEYFTTLLPTGKNANSGFGTSVSLRGNYLVVGAPAHKNFLLSPVGAAYVYAYNGTSWVAQQTIYGTVIDSKYGETVAINQFGTYMASSETNATVAGLVGAGCKNL